MQDALKHSLAKLEGAATLFGEGDSMDLLIALGIAALFTRAGLALYAAGLVRAKNSAATGLRTVSDLCIAVLMFWAIGTAILVHSNQPPNDKWYEWIDWRFVFGPKTNVTAGPGLFFYTVMILTATIAVGGAVAERCRLLPLCLGSAVLAGFLLPLTCNMAWAGWLKRHGFVDVAGGASLHVASGAFALVACAMVGPRQGKFNRDGSSSMIPGHNLPMALVGVLLMLAGWIAYVAGASFLRVGASESAGYIAGAAAMNVLLAAAAAGAASLLFARFRYGKPDIPLVLVGILGGLTSVTAGGAALVPWAAVVIGMVAGVIVPYSVVLIDFRLRLDDPLGVIASQLVGGAWGTLAVGFFLNPVSPPLNRLQLIGIQIVGIAAIAVLSAAVSLGLFAILKSAGVLRMKEDDEFDGLDLVEHDIGAYPDFQQNSIKSYHMREA